MVAAFGHFGHFGTPFDPFWAILDPLLYVRVNSPIRDPIGTPKITCHQLNSLNSPLNPLKMAYFGLLNQLN